ncbi:hypothetical protein SUH3_13335 [Pseudosulfitobacter pseudonitzschiae]|uniref:Uncharacterized protein n=1 Tax=Pseudosulfitobacter pseudonitzschiae TaxID=1402135 RepID=A0A073J3D9_9RHOB|nr:hypothetical protein SUH3_13335 [Pseudosulfitobacter pseudonitzschiae]
MAFVLIAGQSFSNTCAQARAPRGFSARNGPRPARQAQVGRCPLAGKGMPMRFRRWLRAGPLWYAAGDALPCAPVQRQGNVPVLST